MERTGIDGPEPTGGKMAYPSEAFASPRDWMALRSLSGPSSKAWKVTAGKG
jgi:hypothetical protein